MYVYGKLWVKQSGGRPCYVHGVLLNCVAFKRRINLPQG